MQKQKNPVNQAQKNEAFTGIKLAHDVQNLDQPKKIQDFSITHSNLAPLFEHDQKHKELKQIDIESIQLNDEEEVLNKINQSSQAHKSQFVEEYLAFFSSFQWQTRPNTLHHQASRSSPISVSAFHSPNSINIPLILSDYNYEVQNKFSNTQISQKDRQFSKWQTPPCSQEPKIKIKTIRQIHQIFLQNDVQIPSAKLSNQIPNLQTSQQHYLSTETIQQSTPNNFQVHAENTQLQNSINKNQNINPDPQNNWLNFFKAINISNPSTTPHQQTPQYSQSKFQHQQNSNHFQSQFLRDDQHKYPKSSKQKLLSFRIIQIRSTVSPEVFDVWCSIGYIYVIKISLLINLSQSPIHKLSVFSEGSYGNIFLLRDLAKLNSSYQHMNQAANKHFHNCCQKESAENSDHSFDDIQQDFFIVKCFMVRENQDLNELLNEVLKEYCINQMMSALEMGPKLVKKFNFDILVHKNCIEFSMEFCQRKNKLKEGNIQRDLKTALLTMHQINLVHLDIKPDNIAFSSTFNKWILIDFGFSEFIEEKLGQKSFLSYIGTYGYSSPEMKKALSNDTYVDLYYNDIYAFKRSLTMMGMLGDDEISSDSYASQDHSRMLLFNHIEMNESTIEEALILSRLKYELLRENLQMSYDYLATILKVIHEDEFKTGPRIKTGSNQKSTFKHANRLFPMLNYQPHQSLPVKDPAVGTEIYSDTIGRPIQKSKIYKQPNPKFHNAKAQIIRFFKSLLMSNFFVQFYYQHVQKLIEDNSLKIHIEKKISQNMMHHLVRFGSPENDDETQLRKITTALFSKQFKTNLRNSTIPQSQSEIIDDPNEDSFRQTLLNEKPQSCAQDRFQTFLCNRNKKRTKGILHLKQKLLDSIFLLNLSKQQYFNLYYRYVTFKKNTYKATLNDKLMVSEFFIRFHRVNQRQYEDFQQYFEPFLPKDTQQYQKFQQQNQQYEKQRVQQQDYLAKEFDYYYAEERMNYRREKKLISRENNPFYPIIICFRYIIAQCIYIHPSNAGKRQLFIALICEYLLIDDSIMTIENDANLISAWYKVILCQLSFFKTEDQRLKYLSKVSKLRQEKEENIFKYIQREGNFLQVLQKAWMLNQATKLLSFRKRHAKIHRSECVSYIYHLSFILKDKERLSKHFSSLQVLQKFLKYISIDDFIRQCYPKESVTECFLIDSDMTMIKNEILKNERLSDLSKINLFKSIITGLYIYDEFIKNTSKMSNLILWEKNEHTFEKMESDGNSNQTYESQLKFLKESEFREKENRITSNSKKIILELINAPFSSDEIEEFHFHLAQRLQEEGNLQEARKILKLIDKTINCQQLSSRLAIKTRMVCIYYLEKDYHKVLDFLEQVINQINPYEIISNIECIIDLIKFSNLYMNEQASQMDRKGAGLQRRQFDEFYAKNQQFVAYRKFLKLNNIFVHKIKQFVITYSIQLRGRHINIHDYHNFFTVLRRVLYYLRTQQPPQLCFLPNQKPNPKEPRNLSKDIFFEIFEWTLPFCEMYIAQINPAPIMRQMIYSIHDNQDLENNFFVIALETRAMRLFSQQSYTEVCRLISVHKDKLGIDENFNIPHVKQKIETIKILLLYVKAFFVQYVFKLYCWYETYNQADCGQLIISYTQHGLEKFIQHENNLLQNAAGHQYFTAYKQFLSILNFYLISTSNHEIASQYNAPTIQFLIQKAKHINDQQSYFSICIYLISLSRSLSNQVMCFHNISCNIEEFASKNITPVTGPLFEYLLKFTENILLNRQKEFENESKEWKNPYWWLFVNIFLQYSNRLHHTTMKRIFVKISSALRYANKKIAEAVVPLFYLNCYRFHDLLCMKKLITPKKLKRQFVKFLKFRTKNPTIFSLQQCLSLKVKSFSGVPSIFYSEFNDARMKHNSFLSNASKKGKTKMVEAFMPTKSPQFYCTETQRIKMVLRGFKQTIVEQLECSRNLIKNTDRVEKDKKSSQTKEEDEENQSGKSSFNQPTSKSLNEDTDGFQQFCSEGISVVFNKEFLVKIKEVARFSRFSPDQVPFSEKRKYTQSKIIKKIIQKVYLRQKNIQNIQLSHEYKNLVFSDEKSRPTNSI